MKNALKVLVLLFVILSASCKKEDSEAKKKTALLTKDGWLTKKVELKAPDGSWLDVTGTPLPTQTDDLLIFRANGTYEINEGPTKFPGNPQVAVAGTWNFIDNASKIQIVNGNLMEVIELTDAKLQVIVSNPNTQRYTFEHPH